MRKSHLAIVASLTLFVQSCATTDPRMQSAVGDIHRFASSLQAGDLTGIEARIDRPALEAQALRVAQDVAATRINSFQCSIAPLPLNSPGAQAFRTKPTTLARIRRRRCASCSVV